MISNDRTAALRATTSGRALARTAGAETSTWRRMGLALAALSALALALAAVQPALADPPGGVPPGLAKKGVDKREWQRFKGGDDRRYDDRDRVIVYQPGYRLPAGRDYVIIRDYGRYGLQAPPRGYAYYLVEDRVLRVSQETLQIAAVIGLASALLN